MNRTGTTNFDDLEDDAAFNTTRTPRDNGEGDVWHDSEDAFYSKQAKSSRDGVPATFPCQSCGGTGRWSGGRNQNGETKCFACKGAGYFKTSIGDRYKARAAAAARKATRVSNEQGDFNAANPGLIEALSNIASWNGFAASLLEGYKKYGHLTEGQTAAARRTLEKVELARAAKVEKVAAVSGEVDVTKVQAMFDRIKAKGNKRAAFQVEGLELSAAPDHGKNPGAIYVKVQGTYAGKIVGGRLQATASAPSDARALVAKVAADPLGEAVRYGKLRGACACCGRTLTDPVSIERGIGPICAEGWFGA